MADDDDGLTTGALLLGGGLAGYALSHWLTARRDHGPAARPSLALASASAPVPTATTPASPPTTPPPDEPVSSPSQVDPGPASSSLPRDFDPIFEKYRGDIPIEYLRALAKRESGMRPGEHAGPAWGLMQIVEVVRVDFNEAHGTRYTRKDLLDPAVSVAMCCWVLRFIIDSYQRNHPNVPNLRADWNNPRFTGLLTYGWNAGFSEKAGVGRVVTYLEKLGATDIDLDQVHDHAKLAGASRHLSNDAKVRWCKGVVALYQRERAAAQRNGATVIESDDGRVRVTGSTDYLDRWIALKAYLADRRGFDVFGTANKFKVPRTTNADVLQLAAMWDDAAARSRTDVFGVTGAKAEWSALSTAIKQATAGTDPSAVYADNVTFWKVSKHLVIRIQVAAEEPPDVGFVDALESNIKKLPGRLVSAAEWVGGEAKDIAGGAADAAGDAASGAGKIFARGLGPILKPLAIGVGLVGGGYLIVQAMNRRSDRGR